MSELLCPPRRKPPGRLKLEDLKRLKKEWQKKFEDLGVMEDELVDYGPLLGRRSLTEKLERLRGQATHVLDFEIMLIEVLLLYSDGLSIGKLVGLEENWLSITRAKYLAMDKELDEVVRLAMQA